MKEKCMEKLIEMKEMLDEYLANMDMLNDDGSVKQEEESEPSEETVEESEEEKPEENKPISDKDAIILIRKGK